MKISESLRFLLEREHAGSNPGRTCWMRYTIWHLRFSQIMRTLLSGPLAIDVGHVYSRAWHLHRMSVPRVSPRTKNSHYWRTIAVSLRTERERWFIYFQPVRRAPDFGIICMQILTPDLAGTHRFTHFRTYRAQLFNNPNTRSLPHQIYSKIWMLWFPGQITGRWTILSV
jgi:hypothetical protein